MEIVFNKRNLFISFVLLFLFLLSISSVSANELSDSGLSIDSSLNDDSMDLSSDLSDTGYLNSNTENTPLSDGFDNNFYNITEYTEEGSADSVDDNQQSGDMTTGDLDNQQSEDMATGDLDNQQSVDLINNNEQTENKLNADSNNVIYFDASVETNGDGSITSPYKYFKSSYLTQNAIAHFAVGEYTLDARLNKTFNFNLTGDDMEKTIISYNGVGLVIQTEYSIFLSGLTLNNFGIVNKGTLNASNVKFSNSAAKGDVYYNNSFGGAIDCSADHYYYSKLYLDSCIFEGNSANYGGAIYLYNNSQASIKNSQFINNYADNYGGAIALELHSKLNISYCVFDSNTAKLDAGGAIYLIDSILRVDNSNFSYGTGTFGGAICVLSSNFTAENLDFVKNEAVYEGGALYAMYSPISISNSSFADNKAINGAGAFIDNCSSVNICDTNFTTNSANLTGGAIFANGNINDALINVVFEGNAAYYDENFHNQSGYDLSAYYDDAYTLFYNTNEYYDGVLPSSYNLVEEGYVTNVRDQANSGNCWSFAGIASLESAVLKASNKSYVPNFSEENMKNIIEWYSAYGWKMATNGGGYDSMPLGYYASWLGPADANIDPFDDLGVLSPLLNPLTHVQNILWLNRNSYLDNDAIKYALINYGAVATSYYHSATYYDSNRFSYYYNSDYYYANHAVTIVGWDDNYSKNNFRYTPAGNGAWIVKNSWGEEWGDDGYFYVSYYDHRFAEPGDDKASYVFILNDSTRYTKNYQYDIIGMTDWFITSKDVLWYKNIYNATDDEILAAFSSYFYNKTNYTAEIYINNQLVHSQNGTVEYGYHTIKLDKFLKLNKGDTFEVSLKLSGKSLYFPVSESLSAMRNTYKEGVSFFSYDGSTWVDLYSYTGNISSHTYKPNMAASLKAFTIASPNTGFEGLSIDGVDYYSVNGSIEGYLDVDVLTPINISPIIKDEYGNFVNYGKVKYLIDGNEYLLDVEDTLTIQFNTTGKKSMSVEYDGLGIYNNCSGINANFNISILQTRINFVYNIIENYTESFNITVLDENGNRVKKGSISVNITGEDYSYFKQFNITGSSILVDLKLESGDYNLMVNYTGSDIYYNKSDLSFDFNVKKIPSLVLDIDDFNIGENLVINAYLSDNISDIVTVYIGDESYDVIVIGGAGLLEVSNHNLGVGEHVAQAKYSGNYAFFGASYNDSFRVFKLPVLQLKVNEIDYDYFEDINLKVLNPLVITVSVTDEGNPVNLGQLKINIDGVDYYADIVNGLATLNYQFNKTGSFPISLYSQAYGDYNNMSLENINTFVISNLATKILLDYNLLDNYTNNFMLSVLDENDNPVKTGTVLVNIIGSDSIYLKEFDLNDSFMSLNLDLNAGSYVASFNYTNLGMNYDDSNFNYFFKYYGLNNIIVKHTGNDSKDIQDAINRAKPGDTIQLGDNYDYLDVGDINISKNITITAGSNTIIHGASNVSPIFHIVSISEMESFGISDAVEYVLLEYLDFEVANDTVILFTKAVDNEYSSLISEIRVSNIKVEASEGVNPNSVDIVKVETDSKYFNPSNPISVSQNTFISGMSPFELSNSCWGNETDILIPESDSVKTFLSIEKIASGCGEIIISLKDMNSNPVASAIINYTINGAEYYGVTDLEGLLNINSLKEDALLNISYFGDDKYSGSDLQLDYKSSIPLKQSCHFEFANMTTSCVLYARTGEYFTAKLLDANYNPLVNKSVQIGFNGKIYSRTTDEKGSFRLQVNLASVGGYTFAISYLGDDSYNASFAVAKIIVEKNPTKLYVKKTTYKSVESTKTLTASLELADGTPVSGRTIKFTVAGKTYSAKTNSNGIATVNISLTAKKTYTYTVSFGGDSQCNAVTASAKLVIN